MRLKNWILWRHIIPGFQGAAALILLLSFGGWLAAAEDARVKAVYDFLWSRTQANNVIEYTHMTSDLKDFYRYNKKMKIRRESGRLLSFHFDPNALDMKNSGKEFTVDIVGTWVNLNEHVIGNIEERDTFVETPNGWRAGKMKLGKEHPTGRAVVDGFSTPKEYRDAMRVLKLVLRAWANRDDATATRYASVDLERSFRNKEELRQLFSGLSNPHHVAYAIRRIAHADHDRVEFDVELYEMAAMDPQLLSSRVKIEVKKFDSGWFVDSWNPEVSKTSTP